MHHLQRKASGLGRQLLERKSCTHNPIALWPTEPLTSSRAMVDLPVRRFARQRRRTSEAYDDLSPADEEHDGGTGVSRDDAQHRSEPPSGAYRTPAEKLWPTSRNQKKYGARVRDALHTVMMDSGGAAYARLVYQLGFTIVEVRMSLDNMTAFILWDAHDDSLFSAEREIGYRMSQLRRDIGRLLGMRHTPRLEFRLDRLSQEQKAIEDALDKLKAERGRSSVWHLARIRPESASVSVATRDNFEVARDAGACQAHILGLAAEVYSGSP